MLMSRNKPIGAAKIRFFLFSYYVARTVFLLTIQHETQYLHGPARLDENDCNPTVGLTRWRFRASYMGYPSGV